MTMFGTLHPDGSLTNVRNLPQSAMMECPHFIMVSEHYRANNSCRCNDPKHTEMGEWGYVWDTKTNLWIAGEDE